MTQRIQKAAVLGAGTMGARIAAHFANAGLPCLLLDIVPRDAAPAERNQIVSAGLDAAKKSNRQHFLVRAWRQEFRLGILKTISRGLQMRIGLSKWSRRIWK